MFVRRIRRDEVDAYRSMRLRALHVAPYAFAETYQGAASRPDEAWDRLVARAAEDAEFAAFVLDRGDGTLAGSAFVAATPGEPGRAEVFQMWLDEDLRGTGRAAALLAAAEQFAFDFGARDAQLWVYEGNPRARRFYERSGYSGTDVEVRAPEGLRCLLRKELSPGMPQGGSGRRKGRD